MSLPHRARGVKVLKAVSSPLRLQILNLLFDKSALSYTELMTALKMNPSRDAGRFAYHLKSLLRTNLVDAEVETKKYFLTDLGKMVIEVADRIEKNAIKKKGMLVRTSHSTLEEFDANKISSSLIREAKMQPDQAQKTAKDAEKLLLKSRTKYLTAPLVREVVNAILIEKGLEEYRHKLTRLGLPVQEVSNLLESRDNLLGATTVLIKAGQAIFNEYALLNVFPRDVADAHASGAIHINGLSSWLMQPNDILHDLRFFLQKGLRASNPFNLSETPPGDFASALSLIFSVILYSSFEIYELQTLEHFNLFLSPFAKGINISVLKDNLRLFILGLNKHAAAEISIDLAVPSFIAERPAIGPQGKSNATYGDFEEESKLLASLILEVITEESLQRPLLGPRIIVKISKEALADADARTILLKAHGLAANKGILYFANTATKEGEYFTFSSAGSRFGTDLTGDWETDTLRTGCTGMVTVNLPRIVYESNREKNKFFEILKERYELAARTLEIKARMLRQHAGTVLTFITQNSNGDKYLRLEGCSNLVNFAGLQAAAKAFCEQEKTQNQIAEFESEIVQNILTLKTKTSRKQAKRLFPVILPSAEASERLAQLDIEKFGMAKVRFSGGRERPFYSTAKRLQIQKNGSLTIESESLESAQRLSLINTGADLSIIELGQEEYKPEDLANLTIKLFENHTAQFFTYNRIIAHCSNCNKSWFGIQNKCPSCGSISTLTVLNRFGFS